MNETLYERRSVALMMAEVANKKTGEWLKVQKLSLVFLWISLAWLIFSVVTDIPYMLTWAPWLSALAINLVSGFMTTRWIKVARRAGDLWDALFEADDSIPPEVKALNRRLSDD